MYPGVFDMERMFGRKQTGKITCPGERLVLQEEGTR